jgi:hypothetical protein
MKKNEFKVWYRLDSKGDWTIGNQTQTKDCDRCGGLLMVGANKAIFCNKVTPKHKL